MRLYPLELYMANFEGRFQTRWDRGERFRGYMTKQAAYEALKDYTHEDFGYDVDAWKTHINEYGGPRHYRRNKAANSIKNDEC